MTRTITLPIKCSTVKWWYKKVSNFYYNTLDIIGAAMFVVLPWVGLFEILYYAYDFDTVASWWVQGWTCGNMPTALHPVYPVITTLGWFIGITSCICIPAFLIYVGYNFPKFRCIKDEG